MIPERNIAREPEWYKALTLAERAATLRGQRAVGDERGIDLDDARRRAERWRAQPPFDTVLNFSVRLEAENVTEDEWLRLLGEPVEAVARRAGNVPLWLREFSNLFSRHEAVSSLSLPEPFSQEPSLRFLRIVEPLISHSQASLRAGIEKIKRAYPDAPFEPALVAESLQVGLLAQLIGLLTPTLVLELNVARLRGKLNGDTPDARFHSFIQLMSQPAEALALFQEYPVLARQIMARARLWLEASLEFLRRLAADWEFIRDRFGLPDEGPGQLVKIETCGDLHRGGRAVLLARFASGFQIIYKPKSLAIDEHFQSLLKWINGRAGLPPFKTLEVMNRGPYGWVEFVASGGCDSREEVRRFYHRLGGYLALLYAIEAVDFHFENLIAAREHPVLVDLESLFHNRVWETRDGQSGAAMRGAVFHSVLRVGLLPQRLWASAERDGVDVSGLGGGGDQLWPDDVAYWEGPGTDEMRLAKKPAMLRGGKNRPTLNGANVDVSHYSDDIMAGFAAVYRLLMRYRGALLDAGGPLNTFIRDEARAIVRPTHVYAQILNHSLHPNLLRDALDREQFFDRLWVGVEKTPRRQRVIPSERADLLRGDIPFFSTRPSSRDLWDSSGRRIPDFFDEPALTLVHRRLRSLNEDDLSRQLWLIRASLASLSVGIDQERRLRLRSGKPGALVSGEQLVSAAMEIGDRLETLGIRDDDDSINWLGLQFVKDRSWCILPLGVDLYGGLPGVALFLGYLGVVSGQGRYRETAHAALMTLRRQLNHSKEYAKGIGAFSGWGGLIYTHLHLGALWGEPDLIQWAHDAVELLPDLIAQDDSLDIVGGAAGCIASLLSLHHYAPSERALAAAALCGERLIGLTQHAEAAGERNAWPASVVPLTGFSHGAAGMAWALLNLSTATGDARFKATAMEAITYEQSVFSPAAGHWADHRDAPSGAQSSDGPLLPIIAWCHGAAGIGLARIHAQKHSDDPLIKEEIQAAISATLKHGFGLNHSLCHGDMGNIELLLHAGDMFADGGLDEEIARLTAAIYESRSNQQWTCGTPMGVETPGLMTGLAGVGYGLLRLADRARVPSILTLAPPTHVARQGAAD